MKLFVQYLKSHKKLWMLYILCALIYITIFFLSNSDLDPVLYGALLCFIGTAFFVGYDFYKFRKQHQLLQQLADTIDSQIDHLPEPRRLIDEDYTEIIRNLHEEKRRFESSAYIARKEMADYFTLWAHQVKTPISAMDLILQSGDGGERDKRLAMELFHVEEYVNLAMSYIRIEDISQDFGFETISLDHLIRQTLKKYVDVFIGKKITMDFQETNRDIISDSKWLSVVLGQILSNALKYTEEGGKISIYMEPYEPTGKDVLVIEDTGIGIREEDLPRLFSKGFTGYNGRQHSKSSGQGLYICKTIMDKLSHKIFLTSEEGRGTRVFLDFSR